MKRSSLHVKMLVVFVLIILLPVMTSMIIYKQNQVEIERKHVQTMFRERYSIYDRIFDYAQVKYKDLNGSNQMSRGITMLLEDYDARLEIIYTNGMLIYDSLDSNASGQKIDLSKELRMLPDEKNIFTTESRYIRPLVNDKGQVEAYAIISDNTKVLEQKMYAKVQELYRVPYYYGIGAFLIIALLGLFFIYNEIIRPIKKLSASTGEITSGNLDFDLNCYANNEIGDLCNDFNIMKESLKKNLKMRLEEKDRNRMYVKATAEDLKDALEQLRKTDEILKPQNTISVNDSIQMIEKILDDLARYTEKEETKFKLNKEIISSFRFMEMLKKSTEDSLMRELVDFKEPKENCMLFLDTRKILKSFSSLLEGIERFLGEDVKISIDTSTDVVEYDILKIRIFWEQTGIFQESTLEEILESAYVGIDVKEKKRLAAELVLLKEIMMEHGGSIDAFREEEYFGFYIKVPYYTPNLD